jgi:hypothetical protein
MAHGVAVRHCKPLNRNENVLQQAATTDSDHGDSKSLISLAVQGILSCANSPRETSAHETGPSIPDAFRKAAGYVDRILKGAKPADLPIEEPSRFDFIVNLRSARALGLIPEGNFLIEADEVIE